METGEEFDPQNSHFQIPTLDQVVELLDRQVLINIEIKTPRDDARKPNYDVDGLIRVLSNKILTNFSTSHPLGVNQYVFVSSFDHSFIAKYKAMEAESQGLP